MKKIKILVIPSDQFGVGYYRLLWPFKMIQKNHSDEFDITIKYHQEITIEDTLSYDIVHFNRSFPNKNHVEMINAFKANGCKVVMDIDDLWNLPKDHPLYALVKSQNADKITFECLKASEYITATTDHFADYLRTFKDNVIVLPNSIDFDQTMWQNKREPSDKLRIGWIGGSSHEADLKKLAGVFNRLYNDPELKDKFEIVMCGFDTRGTITTTHPTTRKETTRKIRPEESIWVKFEEIFDDYGRAPEGAYIRRKTLPINRYGEHYNFIDVALGPLVESEFNACKSELKAIEAGAMGCAFIGSDVPSYNKLIEHGESGILIPAKKDHKLWHKHIKKMILDREYTQTLADNLHEKVFNYFNLKTITEQRVQFYKEITECKNK